jgi:hypothetical protein
VSLNHAAPANVPAIAVESDGSDPRPRGFTEMED